MLGKLFKFLIAVPIATLGPFFDSGECPLDMSRVQNFCIDKYEAPNKGGEYPLVMYSYLESKAWCETREKRLCYSDEWTLACSGEDKWRWSYSNKHEYGICNDEKIWRKYEGKLLREWRGDISSPEIETLPGLILYFLEAKPDKQETILHVMDLYQAERSGEKSGCRSEYEVYDMVGNVEEWTTKRYGRRKNFNGALKGRFWAEPRTCFSSVRNHGDFFRFYETGFRCCKDTRGDNGKNSSYR
jgi:formylglycine-generating enzyme required for sulfatase activity